MQMPKKIDVKVLDSEFDVEYKAAELEARGWEVQSSFLPLYGQQGYLCTQTQTAAGKLITRQKSYVWNLFGEALTPVFIPCNGDLDFLSFIWTHSSHGITYFEIPDGDCGLVCYCAANRGQSLVLYLGEQEQGCLSEDAWNVLWEYHPEAQEGEFEEKVLN